MCLATAQRIVRFRTAGAGLWTTFSVRPLRLLGKPPRPHVRQKVKIQGLNCEDRLCRGPALSRGPPSRLTLPAPPDKKTPQDQLVDKVRGCGQLLRTRPPPTGVGRSPSGLRAR